ncbi:ATP-dependent DNA helicase [Sorlinia euscelidii]
MKHCWAHDASYATVSPMSQPSPAFLTHGPAFLITLDGASILTQEGTLLALSLTEARDLWARVPSPVVINGAATARRLGLRAALPPHPWRDVLELFLFVHPTTSIAPTLKGVCDALDIPLEAGFDARILLSITARLEAQLARLLQAPGRREIGGLLQVLHRHHWPWRHDLQHLLGDVAPSTVEDTLPLKIWRRLPKWEDEAPPPPAGARPVSRDAALGRLADIIGEGAETRPAQRDFTSVACEAFQPREAPGMPGLVLAEAGTGTGKTAGYLAPASVWAEKNGGTVWVSTYTRHLQKQIERELHALFPDRVTRRRKIVIRKGRENYLCLLNYEDSVNVFAARPDRSAAPMGILLALVARWASMTEDGDLIGGDLPGWFFDFYDRATLLSMADRRGECIYSACPHYQSCFVEHSIRRAKSAEIVVANHALVMSQSAWALHDEETLPDEDQPPTHYVFDEGHHLPDAADSAFSVALSGLEASELRRWLLGAEGGRSRARGLRRRLEDLIAQDASLERHIVQVIAAAQALPSPGWLDRLQSEPQAPIEAAEATELSLEVNPSEAFLQALHQQLRARTQLHPRHDQLECDLQPVDPRLDLLAPRLRAALCALKKPLEGLVGAFMAQLSDPDDILEAPQRIRLEAAARALKRRAIFRLDAWIDLLTAIAPEKAPSDDDRFIDVIRSEAISHRRFSGTRYDIGIHRHWRDPTIPYATVMQASAHGILVTSATLRDQPGMTEICEHDISGGDPSRQDISLAGRAARPSDAEASWRAAEHMMGASHFLKPAMRAAMMSPYDYRNQTRAYIVTDVSHREIAQLAAAFEALFTASRGGALGLFTAINRLRSVYKYLAPRLEALRLPLYAQHVDQMDNATLVDIFRTEIDSCLLGTDAMRDGIDIKGNALRLVVFEKTPWPRPDILHRERRRHAVETGLDDYDDRLTRMRIRQGFGRLIRSSADKGVFVTLDRQFPSRLLSAFPEGVVVERLGLRDVTARVSAFLAEGTD